MRVYAKAMHVGSGGSVKVVLRYQENTEEPIYFGTLHMRMSVWVWLRALIRPHVVIDERQRYYATK